MDLYFRRSFPSWVRLLAVIGLEETSLKYRLKVKPLEPDSFRDPCLRGSRCEVSYAFADLTCVSRAACVKSEHWYESSLFLSSPKSAVASSTLSEIEPEQS